MRKCSQYNLIVLGSCLTKEATKQDGKTPFCRMTLFLCRLNRHHQITSPNFFSASYLPTIVLISTRATSHVMSTYFPAPWRYDVYLTSNGSRWRKRKKVVNYAVPINTIPLDRHPQFASHFHSVKRRTIHDPQLLAEPSLIHLSFLLAEH